MGGWVDFGMENTPTRKLAAIMFTDIAGFTKSMSYDEQLAIQAVRKKRTIIQPLINEYNGIFVKEIGDGTLSYFNSAIDASNCAISIQEKTYNVESLNIRVGIHIGDIVFDKDDVFGDGVNIASRLESLSPVGGVCISSNVYDELSNKKEFDAVSLGLQSLKGVGRVIEIYALKGDKLRHPDQLEYKNTRIEKHDDDEIPSIAIIPFDNKGAEEDVFYAYGISTDLISDCSGAGLIRVASLKDVEKLDYNNLETIEIAKKLLVRYIAQGTLWKMGEMFQLSIELYDTKEKKVIWSDRWQEKWKDLTSIKSNLTDGLLKSLNTSSKIKDIDTPLDTQAYEYYLKANYKYEKRKSLEDAEIAKGLLQKAIDIDNNLLEAHHLLGHIHQTAGDYDTAMKILTPILKLAQDLGRMRMLGIIFNGIGNIKLDQGDINLALGNFEKSLKIFEELDDKYLMGASLLGIGNMYYSKGNYDKALEYWFRVLKINEELNNKNRIKSIYNNIGIAYLEKGNFEESLNFHNRSLKIAEEIDDISSMSFSFVNIGIVYSNKGNYDQALDFCDKSLKIREKLGDQKQIGVSLTRLGYTHYSKGEYKKSLEYFDRVIRINKEIGYKRGLTFPKSGKGYVYFMTNKYDEAIKELQESLALQDEIQFSGIQLITTVYLYLAFKNLNRDYDNTIIDSLIKKNQYIVFETNFRLYQFLEELCYLESSHNQIQSLSKELKLDEKNKFLNYPIPKIITETYNNVKN